MDKYAVMGNPIGHSKSPMIHRLFAQQTQQDLSYEALLVEKEGFVDAVRSFREAGGKGLNITVPFKTEAWEFANKRTELAERAGAVNTLSFDASGDIVGNNTDGIGIVRDIQNNHGVSLEGRTVLVLGAGGAVRGVLEPILAQNPVSILIANRTVSRAQELQLVFSDERLRSCGFDDIPDQAFDVIINGTAASLHGDLPPLPKACASGAFCYDMMYGKAETPFMIWAREAGASQVCDGLGMLVEQAAESFFIWRGVRPQTLPVIEAVRLSL